MIWASTRLSSTERLRWSRATTPPTNEIFSKKSLCGVREGGGLRTGPRKRVVRRCCLAGPRVIGGGRGAQPTAVQAGGCDGGHEGVYVRPRAYTRGEGPRYTGGRSDGRGSPSSFRRSGEPVGLHLYQDERDWFPIPPAARYPREEATRGRERRGLH